MNVSFNIGTGMRGHRNIRKAMVKERFVAFQSETIIVSSYTGAKGC